MKIKKLLLKNFGIFAGKHVIDFSSSSKDKPIILLGGYNGRGKTTILEAILLCLYGKRSYTILDTKMAYNKYLSKYINRNDSTLNASVEVVMEVMIDSTIVDISVNRQWHEQDMDIKEKLLIYMNGKYDVILTDDWDNQIDFIMPIGLSRFFLFDGEKVSELVEDFSGNKLKQAIKTLLGIDIIEQLVNDLKTIINRNKIAKDIEKNSEEIKHLQEQKSLLQSELTSAQHKVAILKNDNEQKILSLEECESLFSLSGGAMFGKQEATIQKRAAIEKELRTVQIELYEKLSGAAPLLLVRELLEHACTTARIENEYDILEHEINGVEKLLYGVEVPEILRMRFEDMKAHRQNLLNTINGITLSLSPAGTEQLIRLCGSFPTDELNNIERLLTKKNELQEKLQNSDDYLLIEFDQKNLCKLVERMKLLNRDITKNQLQIEQLEQDIVTKSQTLANINLELDRLTSNLLAQYELNDSSVRLVKYSLMAKAVLSTFSQRIQHMKINALSLKVTEKFHAIIGKRNLIGKIIFNPNDLSMELYDDTGKVFDRKQLSAGEKQLLSIAIVWGIVEYTGQEFPMIIDTPLARLDTIHREHFVDNYIPNAGKQVIVFSSDAEITNGLEERIDKFVATKYLLHYDEVTKSTTVKEGYFV